MHDAIWSQKQSILDDWDEEFDGGKVRSNSCEPNSAPTLPFGLSFKFFGFEIHTFGKYASMWRIAIATYFGQEINKAIM